MKRRYRQRASIALVMILTLATMLAPAVSVFAAPGDHEANMQHQAMDHAAMSMDSTSDNGCCEPDDCGDCEQDCGTCVVTPVLVINPSLAATGTGADHYPAGIEQLFSNIPPPPNKPPV